MPRLIVVLHTLRRRCALTKAHDDTDTLRAATPITPMPRCRRLMMIYADSRLRDDILITLLRQDAAALMIR